MVLLAFLSPSLAQLFYSFFKTLIGKQVTIELKNDLSLTGKLESVDQFLNLKISGMKVVDEGRYPHLVLNILDLLYLLICVSLVDFLFIGRCENNVY
jgi:small nuclear ribonucleoprotein (snRNP)-like protein